MNTPTTTRRRRRDEAVVVLNASYEPLGVVSLPRAMIHVIAERADVVLADTAKLNAAGSSFERPLIVAFRDYIRVPFTGRRTEAGWRRRLVLQRDSYECAYCERGRGTTIDHLIPQSKGGGSTWMNTVAACLACNGRKSDLTLAEAGMQLRFQPRIVYREETVLLAVERIARSSGRMGEFAAVVPGLALA